MRQGLILTSYLILAAFGFVSQGAAQESNFVPVTGIRVLTLEAVHSGADLSSAPWKYHPGDNPEWANPAFDDTAWESMSTLLSRKELSENRWEGIGWFRLHLSVPNEQLWNLPLALYVTYQAGASEIYLDGELIYKFGTVGTRKEEEKPYWERNPQVISFSGKTDHVIAVRYSNFSSPESIPIRGFGLRLTELNPNIKRHVTIVREVTTFQMVWTAISIFMMLQHLLLFVFYPRARENFYFAISIGSIGAFVFLGFQLAFLATSVTQMLFLLQVLACVYVLMFLAGMLFLYTLFYPKLPKLSWFFLMGWVISICLIFLGVDTVPILVLGATTGEIFEISLTGSLLLSLLTALTFLEMARVIIVAIFKKKDGAWIFGLGSLMPIILPFMFTFFVSYTRYDGNINWQFSALAITLAPLFSMSVYLARNFSRTHRKLETEALERQLLEVENTRKTEELEERA